MVTQKNILKQILNVFYVKMRIYIYLMVTVLIIVMKDIIINKKVKQMFKIYVKNAFIHAKHVQWAKNIILCIN